MGVLAQGQDGGIGARGLPPGAEAGDFRGEAVGPVLVDAGLAGTVRDRTVDGDQILDDLSGGRVGGGG